MDAAELAQAFALDAPDRLGADAVARAERFAYLWWFRSLVRVPWLRDEARAPFVPEPARLVATNDGSGRWCAFSEPVEVSATGYHVWRLTKLGPWVIALGVLLAACGATMRDDSRVVTRATR